MVMKAALNCNHSGAAHTPTAPTGDNGFAFEKSTLFESVVGCGW